jgi:hypothetical protein
MSSVLTFIGWVLSSLLFVGALAILQVNRSIGLAILLILCGILFFPPLYKKTQKWEADGSTWNILSRLGLLLLIPAFLAPWISKQDLSLLQRFRNPFAATPLPRTSPTPTVIASANSSPSPVTVSGTPLPILNPLELKQGQTYVTSGQLSLLPSNDPNNVVANIKQMQLIPPGGLFQVLATDPQKDQLWYRVAAFDQAKRPVGNGWISSKKLTQELAAAAPTLIPTAVPSAIQSGFPSPQPSSSLAAILAKMPPNPAASGSPQVVPSSLEPPTSLTNPSKSSQPVGTNTPKISETPPLSKSANLSTPANLAFKLPSKVIATNTKPGSLAHRVSIEPMPNGSRVVIETTDPNISSDQCKALVKTYMAKANGKGEIIVYKPNPKPPWKGRVLAFCVNTLDEKGTVMKDFW